MDHNGTPTMYSADIAALTTPEEVIERIVASCSCLTKTPELKHHKVDCRYRQLGIRLNELQGFSYLA